MSKWKMVPVEPTDQMIRAIDGLICSSYLWPVYAYRAMIDAAGGATTMSTESHNRIVPEIVKMLVRESDGCGGLG